MSNLNNHPQMNNLKLIKLHSNILCIVNQKLHLLKKVT